MPTREKFAALTAAIAEAAAACESAHSDLLRIKAELDALIAQSQVLTLEQIEAEAYAQRKLSDSVATLALRLTQAEGSWDEGPRGSRENRPHLVARTRMAFAQLKEGGNIIDVVDGGHPFCPRAARRI